MAFGRAHIGRSTPGGLSDAAARSTVRAALGPHAVLDAAGVCAMFAAITRVVDLTGHRSSTPTMMRRGAQLGGLVRQNWQLLMAGAAAAAVYAFILS